MSKKCTGQVWNKSWFNNFWQSYAPFILKIIWNFQFLFIFSPTVLHMLLKFHTWIPLRNVQIKVEFGHGLVIFGRVIPLLLWKKRKFSVPFIISPTVVHIHVKFSIWICHKNTLVKFEFGHGLMIAYRVIPLELWKNQIS
jgi:hypothetical protein